MNTADALLAVLVAAAPERKADAARRAALAAAPSTSERKMPLWPDPPDRPRRPARPALVPPAMLPRRRPGSPEGRIALLHAVAHIEFNAIDLAADMALRFAPQIAREGLDWRAFVADWARIAAEEALHFSMIAARLGELGSFYGALPAHDGLWQAAATTSDDALARLAIAPLVLEARGLDVTPGMIEKFEKTGDEASVAVLARIYDDEIGHVATGLRWFEAVCAARRLAPEAAFRALVDARFTGGLKPPFNHEGRSRAGLKQSYYAG